jgi:hypothetical protein
VVHPWCSGRQLQPTQDNSPPLRIQAPGFQQVVAEMKAKVDVMKRRVDVVERESEAE